MSARRPVLRQSARWLLILLLIQDLGYRARVLPWMVVDKSIIDDLLVESISY